MDHFRHIYSHRAADYHRMITPEDGEGHLLPALQRVAPLADKRILDLGTGSGRLPLLLGAKAAQVVGLDLHAAMLQEQQRQRERVAGRWGLVQGDMRALPFPGGWAEVVTAGWAIGHLRGWYPQDWQAQIGRVVQEMHRVVKPGGALIIIETLTTGSLTPAPPTPGLAEYYAWLENEWGFTRQTIRTDYQFASVEEAADQTEFFFGPELAATIRRNGWATLPEWTGVWGKPV
ncbi:MAG: class I SAM-dependent methyltransferase [Anaerolineae bacterium]|nr:class I SAM-dependent methyltransferase [Anaerolineales bacterium]MCQ3972268.1 class I SAM-dependent methyltransferase [Anaerolineae bacterium]